MFFLLESFHLNDLSKKVHKMCQGMVRRIDQGVMDMLPRSVELVVGDVGDPASIKSAIEGCNKIIYCATARSTITGDLNRVDNRGIYNVAKAFQVLSGPVLFFCAGTLYSKDFLLIPIKRSICNLRYNFLSKTA